MADSVLEQLEESKEKAKRAILLFGDKAGKKIEKTERDIVSTITRQNKRSTQALSSTVEKYQQLQNLPSYKIEGVSKLGEHFLSYCVKDNSAFVFGVLKRCLCGCFGCTAPKSFLAPIPQPEITENLKDLKEFVLESCTSFFEWNTNFIFILSIADKRGCESLGVDSADSTEQLSGVMNKAIDILCERFDKAVKEVKEILGAALERVTELKEALLEENSKRYNALCDEVLGMEEGNGSKPFSQWKEEDLKRLQAVPHELSFIELDDEFYDVFFNKLLIIS